MPFNSIILQSKTRSDDIAAFEMLFRKYYAELVNYSFGFTHDQDASEEIIQEFFYNYWKNRKRINIKFSLKAYLYRSIRNNTLNYLDNLKVRRKYAESLLNVPGDRSGYENRELEYAELNEMIEKTLSELPERCRLIFCMSRFEGFKYEEIANQRYKIFHKKMCTSFYEIFFISFVSLLKIKISRKCLHIIQDTQELGITGNLKKQLKGAHYCDPFLFFFSLPPFRNGRQ